MGGSTHIVIGAASAVIISSPNSTKELILSTGIGALGGLISDIDTSRSKITNALRSFLIILLVGSFIIVKTNDVISVSVLQFMKDYILKSSNTKQFIAIILFLILLIAGTFTKHRKVTHSIEYALCMVAIIYFINPNLPWALFAGMVSHTLLDILNFKKVTVSVVLKFEVCLKVCKSNGLINWVMTMFGGVLYGIAIYLVR